MLEERASSEDMRAKRGDGSEWSRHLHDQHGKDGEMHDLLGFYSRLNTFFRSFHPRAVPDRGIRHGTGPGHQFHLHHLNMCGPSALPVVE